MDQENLIHLEYKKNFYEDVVHSSGLRGYLDVMQQLGINPMPLLAKHNLQAEQLQDDHAWISHVAMIQLLEESAQQSNCMDLGLRISTHQDIGILGVLGSILRSAATFRDVIKYSSDLLFLHCSAVRMYFNDHVNSELFEQDEEVIEIILDFQLKDSSTISTKRQSMDLALGACHRVLRYLSGDDYQLLKVTLPHTPIAPLSVYKRFFKAEVLPNQKHAALYLHKRMLNIQLKSADQGLRQIVDAYLEHNFHNQHGSIIDRVSHALRIHLSTSKATKTDIAYMLAMHPRSLQRKLQEEGTSFEMVKDKLKQQLFLQYLADSQISLSQIALILGFSEQSALSRACKNWFGMTPMQLKKLRN